MKKVMERLGIVLLVLAVVFAVVGCDNDTISSSTVSSVTVTTAGNATSVEKGDTLQFSANVEGTNNPAQTVTWSIVETDKKSKTSISSEGLLIVADDETLISITVKATSIADTSKNGTIQVSVVYNSGGNIEPPKEDDPASTGEKEISVVSKSVQDVLNEAETYQESATSAKFISANYDPDLGYVILIYKVGTIDGMFLQYLSKVVVAAPGREFTYSEIVGNSLTNQIENINTTAVNFSGTVWFAGAGAIAGANVFAGLGSLTGLGPQAKENAYATAGAAAGKVSFDFESVTTTRYTETYESFLVVQNTIKQDMSIYPAGKKYAVAAFADVGIYQILKYDPQTKTASAIPGKSLWFNVESRPYWDIYEYSREEELSIPQQLKPFEKVNVEVKEADLFARLEKSQTITFDVGDKCRVPAKSYITDWKPVTLITPVLKDFGYKTISFEWKTYWAENSGSLDCTAHVVLDCADRNLSRGNDWTYYDQEKNPGAGWKWTTWNFSSPIDTVEARPYIRCAYGYYKRDVFLWEAAHYVLSETVTVTITAQK